MIIVSRLFAPEVGAAAFRLKALATALDDAGAIVQVLTTRPPQGGQCDDASLNVSRWPVLRDAGGNVRGYIQYLSFDVPVFFRLLFSRGADVIVVEPPPTTGLFVSLAAAIRMTPFVYFSADVSSSAAKGIGLRGPVLAILTGLERFVLRRAKSILAVSEGVKSEVAALTGRSANVHNVGTGVDTRVFSYPGPEMAGGGQYFVYAGTMSEIQGAGVFVDAFLTIADEYPGMRLIMFGQGVELAALKEKAKVAGDSIMFKPPASGEEVSTWLRAAVANLASVRPGMGYDFAFATKSLAGMSAGAPAIYAGVGPLRGIIEDRNLGHVCEWDVLEVASAMKRAIEQSVTPQRRSEISAWVDENYSLGAVGRTAAGVVLTSGKRQ